MKFTPEHLVELGMAQENEEYSDILNLYTAYFNIGYYICFIPFRCTYRVWDVVQYKQVTRLVQCQIVRHKAFLKVTYFK